MAKHSTQDSVREYYAQFDEREWNRLVNPEDGAIEFAVTCHALSTYLPESGRILDIGGGPGRYTIWLAKRGYNVVLADLSPNLLDIAKDKIAEAGVESFVESITVADACDLKAWEDDAFDAVLSLGPFYHLPDLDDRRRAAAEIVRVLRPQSPVFIALMPLYAYFRRTMAVADERKHLLQQDWLSELYEEGKFENDIAGRFNSGFGVRPEEVKPFFNEFGLESLDLLAAESLSVGLQGVIADLSTSEPEMHTKVMELMIDAASDPTIHGLSSHLLYVGQKG